MVYKVDHKTNEEEFSSVTEIGFIRRGMIFWFDPAVYAPEYNQWDKNVQTVITEDGNTIRSCRIAGRRPYIVYASNDVIRTGSSVVTVIPTTTQEPSSSQFRRYKCPINQNGKVVWACIDQLTTVDTGLLRPKNYFGILEDSTMNRIDSYMLDFLGIKPREDDVETEVVVKKQQDSEPEQLQDITATESVSVNSDDMLSLNTRPRQWSRRPVQLPDDWDQIVQDYKDGKLLATEAAKKAGISVATFSRKAGPKRKPVEERPNQTVIDQLIADRKVMVDCYTDLDYDQKGVLYLNKNLANRFIHDLNTDNSPYQVDTMIKWMLSTESELITLHERSLKLNGM